MIDKQKVEVAVRMLLEAMGEDPDREGLLGTPDRVARMYTELYKGYDQDPAQLLERTFDEDHQEMVVVKDIQFYSACEHHMVVFYGKVHIAYIPNGKVVGISKLARLVECFARRLQIQERLTSQIADAIEKHLGVYGVAVVVEASHMCMESRGVNKPGAKTQTAAMRGLFRDNSTTRAEFYSLIERD